MTNKSCCNQRVEKCDSPALVSHALWVVLVLTCVLVLPARAFAGDAPAWMHAVANVPLPAHDEKTNAVLLYSEQIVSVQSESKIKTVVREAYKILRPDGRDYGTLIVPFHPGLKITNLHGWSIPAQGKDYEVKEKEAMEVALGKIEGSELVDDTKDKVLRIPAADPGNIVGYEYEQDEQPYALQDVWEFQETVPVREAHYTLQLPPGWEFKTTFLNTAEIKPTQSGNQWQWSVSDVKALKPEEQMPPWRGVVGQMIVSYFPSGGSAPGKTFSNWQQMGSWYADLARGRNEASPEIKQKAGSIASAASAPLDRVRAIAEFMQKDIRYVAIELGIGGWQPHPATEVFDHRYGDCKDKATLMGAMLREVGVDSYYVVINTERGSVTPEVQAYLGAFDHVIIAIRLAPGLNDPSLVATLRHPKFGNLLFFDPTNEFVPFGEIGGYLQDNYGLLVTPDGGELVKLPRQPGKMNGINRTAKLTLTSGRALTGDFEETRIGDRAWSQREALRSVAKEEDRIKPIETLLARSLPAYQITKASVANFQQTSEPFQYRYSIVAPDYAKSAGGLLLVRPRVIGNKSSALLETKEPRQFPVEFEGPSLDVDTFEITLPPGYEVEDLPPPVNADYSFGSYHSKTEASGNVLRYTRSYEIKELSVPLSKVDDLKKFYRMIASDERNTAVLKPAAGR